MERATGGRPGLLAEPLARRGRRPASHRDPADRRRARHRPRRAARGHDARGDRRDDGRAARSGRGVPAAPHRRAGRDLAGSSASIPTTPRGARALARPARRQDLARRRGRARQRRRSTSRSGGTSTASAPTSPRSITRELPRDRPYNSFVILPDGHLALKDFGGALPAGIEPVDDESCELLVLEPEHAGHRRERDAPRAFDRAPVRRRATTSTSSASSTSGASAGTGTGSRSTPTSIRGTAPSPGQTLRMGRRARPTARPGSSTTARAPRASRARSPAAACRRRRSTWCASTSRPPRSTLTEICGLPERDRRQPARRRRRPAHRGRLRQRQRRAGRLRHRARRRRPRRAGREPSTTRAIRSCIPTPASWSRTTTTPSG